MRVASQISSSSRRGFLDRLDRAALAEPRRVLPHLFACGPQLNGSRQKAPELCSQLGTTAIAYQLARKGGRSPSVFLMPMAFASLLGGIVTLVGTSPNVIVARVRAELGGEPFGMFDFTPVGIVVALAGCAFLAIGFRLLPQDRRGAVSLDQAIDIKDYVTEAEIGPKSTLAGKTVADLKAQGVDKIIALTHIGYAEDQALAAAVDGVDVYVGGHSHSFLETGNDKAAGPYPTVVTTPSGAPALVVQAGSYGTHLGRLDVTFDGAGVATAWTGGPVALGAEVAQDPVVQDKIVQLNVPLAQLRNQPVGEAGVELVGTSDACRFGECNLGNLIADAMLWATRDQGTRIAVQNGGGIRSGIPAGRVTMGQVIEVLPFSNTLATFGISGADLRASLEGGVSRTHDRNASGTGRFPQVAGLRYAFDPARPEGERIQSVEVREPDGSFRPLDPAATYKVATNNFVRAGGDGYGLFAKAADAYDFGPNLEMVVAEYIKANGPVAPRVEGRITRAQ